MEKRGAWTRGWWCRESRRKKILPPTSLKPYLTPRVPHAAPGNFSMAPAELEFSLIFTFSRRPPRGSAIVRAASFEAPTTITEKMQRSEPGYTYLPTYQPNGAKLSIATLSNKADPSQPSRNSRCLRARPHRRRAVASIVPLFCGTVYRVSEFKYGTEQVVCKGGASNWTEWSCTILPAFSYC